jgi:hypothetical protein
LAISIREIPAGFFIEVVNGSDEIVVGSVADFVKDIICHNGRTAEIFDRKWAIKIYVGLLPPVFEPLSKFLVVFVGSVVLYTRLARPSFWLWVWDLRHFFEFF